jgi:hypothetical protein
MADAGLTKGECCQHDDMICLSEKLRPKIERRSRASFCNQIPRNLQKQLAQVFRAVSIEHKQQFYSIWVTGKCKDG